MSSDVSNMVRSHASLAAASHDLLKVGVIGVGHLGQHHARVYASLPGVELVAVADVIPDRAHQVAEQYGVAAYTDFTKFLPDVQAVSVAVPTVAHYPVTVTCLKAGLHVLLEKPITVSPSEGTELVRLAHNTGRILQIGHVERFNPIVDVVRPHIQNPGFIECHRLSPFQPRGTDVDVVLDLMIHDLDLVLSFHPDTINKIDAAGVAVLSDHVDIANARLEFSQGCVANLTASRVSTGRLRKLRVFQPNAYISVDYQTAKALILHRQLTGNNDDSHPSIQTERLRGDDEEPLFREIGAFVKSVRTLARPQVSGEEGVAALALAHRILETIHVSKDQCHLSPLFSMGSN